MTFSGCVRKWRIANSSTKKPVRASQSVRSETVPNRDKLTHGRVRERFLVRFPEIASGNLPQAETMLEREFETYRRQLGIRSPSNVTDRKALLPAGP